METYQTRSYLAGQASALRDVYFRSTCGRETKDGTFLWAIERAQKLDPQIAELKKEEEVEERDADDRIKRIMDYIKETIDDDDGWGDAGSLATALRLAYDDLQKELDRQRGERCKS